MIGCVCFGLIASWTFGATLGYVIGRSDGEMAAREAEDEKRMKDCITSENK